MEEYEDYSFEKAETRYKIETADQKQMELYLFMVATAFYPTQTNITLKMLSLLVVLERIAEVFTWSKVSVG